MHLLMHNNLVESGVYFYVKLLFISVFSYLSLINIVGRNGTDDLKLLKGVLYIIKEDLN